MDCTCARPENSNGICFLCGKAIEGEAKLMFCSCQHHRDQHTEGGQCTSDAFASFFRKCECKRFKTGVDCISTEGYGAGRVNCQLETGHAGSHYCRWHDADGEVELLWTDEVSTT